MKQFIFISGFIFLISSCAFQAKNVNKEKSSIENIENKKLTVQWGDHESNLRFARSSKLNFYKLVNNFEPQVNKFYCGPAAAVIVLNSLLSDKPEIKKPIDLKLYRGSISSLSKNFTPVFERYTQDAFFNQDTDKIKTQKQIFGEDKLNGIQDFGLQLRQLGDILKLYPVNVNLQVVTPEINVSNLKQSLIASVIQVEQYVIVNFDRRVLGQAGSGHISVLGAYDPETDSVLVLDVNPAFQPWFWVNLDVLVDSMKTRDLIENRGYIVLSNKN